MAKISKEILDKDNKQPETPSKEELEASAELDGLLDTPSPDAATDEVESEVETHEYEQDVSEPPKEVNMTKALGGMSDKQLREYFQQASDQGATFERYITGAAETVSFLEYPNGDKHIFNMTPKRQAMWEEATKDRILDPKYDVEVPTVDAWTPPPKFKPEDKKILNFDIPYLAIQEENIETRQNEIAETIETDIDNLIETEQLDFKAFMECLKDDALNMNSLKFGRDLTIRGMPLEVLPFIFDKPNAIEQVYKEYGSRGFTTINEIPVVLTSFLCGFAGLAAAQSSGAYIPSNDILPESLVYHLEQKVMTEFPAIDKDADKESCGIARWEYISKLCG